MIERFHDTERAIAYLCAELRAYDPTCKVLITSYPKGHERVRTHVAESAHMIPILDRFCERYSEAVAICGLHYGPYTVGGIQCHCYHQLRTVCPLQCATIKERPLVTVVAFKEDLDITDEGRLAVLELVVAEAERQATHPDDRIGRHGKAASVRRH